MVSTETSVTPQYPIYIISKGRAESRLTSKALEKMHVAYRIVIESQEYADYAKVIDPAKILLLPFANLGQGSIPARNWVWEHSLSEGHTRHWILDDNISEFSRLFNNKRLIVDNGSLFAEAECYVDRYANVALAGMQYRAFAKQGEITKSWDKPYNLNTRIYSCILIQNDILFRWRGRYNEDTDLSLRVLKAGFCTVLFYAYLCNKQPTLTMKGGNTDELYVKTDAFDGRLEMAKSLYCQHPDVTKITRKWGRWQHQVDYRKFRGNQLKLKDTHGTTT